MVEPRDPPPQDEAAEVIHQDLVQRRGDLFVRHRTPWKDSQLTCDLSEELERVAVRGKCGCLGLLGPLPCGHIWLH